MRQMFDFRDTGGLFDHFEVNRESFWRKMTWLIAGSGAWHLVILALILLIPPVRDAFALTAMFRDVGFVDRAYNHTDIDYALIDAATTEKFRYPDGYWTMDQQGMPPLNQFSVAPFTPTHYSANPNLLPSPSITPTPSPTPGVPAIAANNGTDKPGTGKPDQAKAQPSVSPESKAADQAQKDLEAAAKKTGIELPAEGEINKAPFKALAMYATDLRDGGKLDFNKSFEVRIETTLDKDGKLVNPKVTQKSGDETLIDLGKELVSAMNDSGVLYYLKKINDEKPGATVVFTISQQDTDVNAMVETELNSPDSATRLSKAFSLMLTLGAKTREDHDEGILLKNTKVSADGNKLAFKLNMQHQAVVDIVQRGMQPDASPTVTPGQ